MMHGIELFLVQAEILVTLFMDMDLSLCLINPVLA